MSFVQVVSPSVVKPVFIPATAFESDLSWAELSAVASGVPLLSFVISAWPPTTSVDNDETSFLWPAASAAGGLSPCIVDRIGWKIPSAFWSAAVADACDEAALLAVSEPSFCFAVVHSAFTCVR